MPLGVPQALRRGTLVVRVIFREEILMDKDPFQCLDLEIGQLSDRCFGLTRIHQIWA